MEGTPIDREKMLSLSVMGKRNRNTVREYHDKDGVFIKETTHDEIGTVVTEHANSLDQVDVMIHPETVHMESGVQL